jgi:hypothetical protein
VLDNAAIWTRQDHPYLRHWIARCAPELVEGIHYTIMFYGGSLLRHLSARDPAVDAFTALPRLNRNFAVVIDSDRTHEHQQLGETKQRVLEEVAANEESTHVLVTAGYTIENYVLPELLASAVTKVHGRSGFTSTSKRYKNPLGADRFA